MPSKKKQVAIRLSDQAKAILEVLAKTMGLTQAGVIETLLREKIKSESTSAITQEIGT